MASGVRVRLDVRNPQPPCVLLIEPRHRRRKIEYFTDRGSLGVSVDRIDSGDIVGGDPALTIGGPTLRFGTK